MTFWRLLWICTYLGAACYVLSSILTHAPWSFWLAACVLYLFSWLVVTFKWYRPR